MLMLQTILGLVGARFSSVIMIFIMIAVFWIIIRFVKNLLSGNNRSGRGLYRSRKNCVVAGVCGGIAEQFNVSPLGVRVLWLISGIGLPVYVMLWLIVPEDNYKSPFDGKC